MNILQIIEHFDSTIESELPKDVSFKDIKKILVLENGDKYYVTWENGMLENLVVNGYISKLEKAACISKDWSIFGSNEAPHVIEDYQIEKEEITENSVPYLLISTEIPNVESDSEKIKVLESEVDKLKNEMHEIKTQLNSILGIREDERK
jgi:hypothetical protein